MSSRRTQARGLAGLLLAAAGGAAQESVEEPGFVMDPAGFPHASVAVAMESLLDNRDAALKVERGWTIFDETVAGRPVNWVFPPDNHPAHPSAVRRTALDSDGMIRVQLSYRCEAPPAACDSLLRELRDANEAMVREFERRLGRLDHPRQAEAVAFAERWLEMADQGRHEESIAHLTAYSRSGYTPESWRREREAYRLRHGVLTLRRLRSVTWFENPPGVPLAGTFAFMEFEAIYERVPFEVQYVVLHAPEGAAFRVMLDERSFLRLVRKPR